MAIKPNETYSWGENATHEQVAAYDDTGWPSDVIPPKRTQFNWYQNLVGKWLGWAEEAVDEIVSTVLERWFTVVYSNDAWTLSIPNENGLYEHRLGSPSLHLERWLVTVTNGTAIAVKLRINSATAPTHFELAFGVWDDGLSAWVSEYTFNRANTRPTILQESSTRYVTPKGLVDYFRTDSNTFVIPTSVPHQTGVYIIGIGSLHAGVSIVVGDIMAFIPADSSEDGASYSWDGADWVPQGSPA